MKRAYDFCIHNMVKVLKYVCPSHLKPILFQISAQESRRKKKEFVDTLERKVEIAVQELEEYKKKCDVLQKQNTTLKSQIKSLKAMVANNNSMNSECKLPI